MSLWPLYLTVWLSIAAACWALLCGAMAREDPRLPGVLDAFAKLPELPEADRMRTKPKERAKVTTLDEWKQRYTA